jgi:hypothetical protein
VPAGDRRFDDEAIDAARSLLDQRTGQRRRRRDGEKLRPMHRRCLARPFGFPKPARIKRCLIPLIARPENVERDAGRFVAGEPIEHGGDVPGNPRAHEHDLHPRQHGPVEARKDRELDLV